MRLQHWLRYHIKLMLAAGLYYSGALRLLLRWRFRRRGVVLMYHRVLPDTECTRSFSSRGIIVSPATFERHLRFLQRHFTVIGPEEFRDWLLDGRDLPKPPCLITFDDGWKDNLVHALPVLKSQQLPAVIFLPTDYIGTGQLFWQERLSRLLYRLGQQPALRTHALVAQYGLGGVFDARRDNLAEYAGTLARTFKGREAQEIDRLFTALSAILAGADESTDVDTYLNWDDVRKLRKERISFGSHSLSHRILTQLPPADVTTELGESRRILEQHLQAPVHFLAYPNGNHDAATCAQARQAGYQLAFTTLPGTIVRGDDPMALPRINIHDGAHRHLPLFCTSLAGVL